MAVRPHRPRELQPRGLRRAAASFADTHGDDERCLVKLGCKGPVVKCNVPMRGWVNGIGGCPNVGGICMACTMPGFPDRFMPFMDPDRLGDGGRARRALHLRPGAHGTSATAAMRTTFEREPAWRRPATELLTGHERRW